MPEITLHKDLILASLLENAPGAQMTFLSDPDSGEVTAIMNWEHPEVASPTSEDLEELYLSTGLALAKDRAKAAIDAEAETRRNRVLTPGSGQALTYLLKEEQAKAYLGAQSPVLADYPLIEAEIGITAGTAEAVASAIVSASAAWREFGAKVERARLGGKKQVEAAQSQAEIQAALAGITWPSIN